MEKARQLPWLAEYRSGKRPRRLSHLQSAGTDAASRAWWASPSGPLSSSTGASLVGGSDEYEVMETNAQRVGERAIAHPEPSAHEPAIESGAAQPGTPERRLSTGTFHSSVSDYSYKMPGKFGGTEALAGAGAMAKILSESDIVHDDAQGEYIEVPGSSDRRVRKIRSISQSSILLPWATSNSSGGQPIGTEGLAGSENGYEFGGPSNTRPGFSADDQLGGGSADDSTPGGPMAQEEDAYASFASDGRLNEGIIPLTLAEAARGQRNSFDVDKSSSSLRTSYGFDAAESMSSATADDQSDFYQTPTDHAATLRKRKSGQTDELPADDQSDFYQTPTDHAATLRKRKGGQTDELPADNQSDFYQTPTDHAATLRKRKGGQTDELPADEFSF
jgi:hypothetical protein